MFSGITVPLDGSPLAESALPYALALGDATGVPVTLVHTIPLPQLSLDYQLRYDATTEAALLARASDTLEARAQSLRTGTRRVEAYVTAGNASEEIVRFAERSAGRCIVMATHGWGGLLHWAFGSVARKVLTTATVPTFVVRPQGTPEHPEQPATIRNILVPLDGSDLAREALTLVKTFAKPLGAAVTLVRIIPIPNAMYIASPYTPMMTQPYFDEAIAAEREAAIADLDASAEELRGVGIAATSVVQTGSPANRLLDLLAEHTFDLVVMSSHGRTGIRRWVLGSVAERLVETSHTPVLIVRAAAGAPVEGITTD
jgi:nucleotide-binding universal stress UspA family protein